MKKSLIWRAVLIVGLAALAVFAAYPLKEKINLGLDLQGGIHLVLQVQTQDAVRAETDKDMEVLAREAADDGMPGVTTRKTSDTSFEVAGVPADKGEAFEKVASDYLPGWDRTLSGAAWSFRMRAVNEKAIRDGAVNQALQTIRNRVDQFGVSEPVISRQGMDSDRIVVQLPGVDDPERVKRLIKNTAFLEFRLCAFPASGGGAGSREEVLQHYGGALPADVEILPQEVRDPQGKTIATSFYGLEKRRVITGRDLKSANPSRGQFGQPVVQFLLTAEGAQMFGKATGDNVGRGLAIVLDGKVVSAPRINSRITDSGIIEGSFTDQEVQDLVTTLRSGALPAGITYLEDRTVGPSLGQDSIEASLRAGLYSMLCVVLSMLIIYRLSGVNALLGLRPERRAAVRRARLLRRHADAARHRRHGALDRHGGRRQRADLRADQGGAEDRPHRARRDRRRLRERPLLDHGLEHHDPDRRALPLPVRHRPGARLRGHALDRHPGHPVLRHLRLPLAVRPDLRHPARRASDLDLRRPDETRIRAWTFSATPISTS